MSSGEFMHSQSMGCVVRIVDGTNIELERVISVMNPPDGVELRRITAIKKRWGPYAYVQVDGEWPDYRKLRRIR